MGNHKFYETVLSPKGSTSSFKVIKNLVSFGEQKDVWRARSRCGLMYD